ncbi:flagellar biosynthetic protein FliR [Rhizobacter sp. P5_C2]|jgi:flagellar biosynthetic protein FliR
MIVMDPHWVAAAAFLSLRLGVLLMLTPLMTLMKAPVSARLLFTLSLAAMLAAGGPTSTVRLDDPVALALAALSEVLLGAVLAFGLHAAFAAVQLAARLVDLQVGFGVGGVYDPSTRSETSALVMGLQWLALIVFFGLDGHHALLRGLAWSIEAVPPGTSLMRYPLVEIVRAFGLLFTLGVTLGAPVIVALLLLDAGLAVVSRALPQMNVFFVSMPLKIALGLGLLALASRQFAPLMNRGYADVFAYWQGVLR